MLPPEILDHLFSFLKSDPSALKASARAHPAFSRLVERHLYAHITVSCTNEAPNEHTFSSIQLRKLLSDKHHISNYVYSLEILANRLEDSPLFPHEESDLAIPPILGQLPNLRRVVLRSRGNFWELLVEELRRAFLECLRLPSIKEVSVRGLYGFPLSALHDCSGLKYLLIEGECSHLDATSNRLFPPLESLSVYNCSTLTRFVAWAKLGALRSLEFQGTSQQYFDKLPELLEACSGTLTSLVLGLHNSCKYCLNIAFLWAVIQCLSVHTEHNPFPVNLSSLPLLEELTIRASVYTDQLRIYSSSLPRIAHLLLTPGPTPTLKYLTFYLDFDVRRTFYLSAIDWTPLVLVIVICIQTLHRVEVRVTNKKYIENIPSANILSSLEDHKTLTDLVERGPLIMVAE